MSLRSVLNVSICCVKCGELHTIMPCSLPTTLDGKVKQAAATVCPSICVHSVLDQLIFELEFLCVRWS